MATKHVDLPKSDHKIKIRGAGCQAVEGNPLTEDEILMFEMFEREGWSDEQCRTHILALVTPKNLNLQR